MPHKDKEQSNRDKKKQKTIENLSNNKKNNGTN